MLLTFSLGITVGSVGCGRSNHSVASVPVNDGPKPSTTRTAEVLAESRADQIELDADGDGTIDRAQLVETANGWQLEVIRATTDGPITLVIDTFPGDDADWSERHAVAEFALAQLPKGELKTVAGVALKAGEAADSLALILPDQRGVLQFSWNPKYESFSTQLVHLPAPPPVEQLSSGILALACPRNGDSVVIGCEDGSLTLRSADGSLSTLETAAQSEAVRDIAFSPNDEQVFSHDGLRLSVYDLADPTPRAQTVQLAEEEQNAVVSFSLSPDGTIVTGHHDGSTAVWNAASEGSRRLLPEHGTSPVLATYLAPSAKSVSSVSIDGTVRNWASLSAAPKTVAVPIFPGSVARFFSDGQRLLLSGGNSPTVCAWDVASGTELGCLQSDDEIWVSNLSVSADNSFAATAENDGTVRLWDLSTWQPVGRARITGTPYAVDFAGSNCEPTTSCPVFVGDGDGSLHQVDLAATVH